MWAPPYLPVHMPELPNSLRGVPLYQSFAVAADGRAIPKQDQATDVKRQQGFSFDKALKGIKSEAGSAVATRGDGLFNGGASFVQKGNYVQLAPCALDPGNAEQTLKELDRLAAMANKSKPTAAGTTPAASELAAMEQLLQASSLAGAPTATKPRPQQVSSRYKSVHAAAESLISDLADSDDGSHARVSSSRQNHTIQHQSPPCQVVQPMSSMTSTACAAAPPSLQHSRPGQSMHGTSGNSQACSNGPCNDSALQLLQQETTPVWSMQSLDADNKGPARFELKVELPRLESADQAAVDVGLKKVVISTPGLYHLTVDLPEEVDECGCRAKWSKAARRLTLTLPKRPA